MEGKKNIIKEKTFSFAVDIVELYKILIDQKKEYVISKQLLRSGTSIGANIREAHNAESDKDFIHKFGIAQKEADETMYWLELLNKTGFIDESKYLNYNMKCLEIIKIIRSVILSVKQRIGKEI